MAMTQPIAPMACCQDAANREPVPFDRLTLKRANATGATPSVQQCRVCGRKHYTLHVRPVTFGVAGMQMGGRPV